MRDVLIFNYLRVLRLDDYGRSYLRVWIAGDSQFEKRTDLLLAQLSVNSLRSVIVNVRRYKYKLRATLCAAVEALNGMSIDCINYTNLYEPSSFSEAFSMINV